MTTPRILLVGYYGKGNFGDDVLLKTTHGVLKRAMPGATFSVIVDGDAGAYVPALLGGVQVLKPGRHGHFNLIVHGGGGVFFDFKRHGFWPALYERLLRLFGFCSYVAIEKIVRSMVGKKRTSATHRLGFGIGVGTFTAGSPRLRASLPIIANFSSLWVRDAESVTNLKVLAPVAPKAAVVGSDLAFLTSYWMPGVPAKAAAARPRLGIVLRDWAVEQGGLPEAVLVQLLAQLADDYDITGFVFDQHADIQLQRVLAPYRMQVWRPESMSIDVFSAQLATQDVLLTSRAHGAICGACLGVASVIVAIEPKLMQVHAMLPQASVLVGATDTQYWGQAIRQALAISPQAIAEDVEKNRVLSQAALSSMQEYFA